MGKVLDDLKKKLGSATGAKIEQKTDEKNHEEYKSFIRAEAMKLNNMFDDAIEEYKKVLKLNPHHLEAMKGLGVVYKYSSENEKALEIFKKAINEMPFDKVIYNEAASCCIKLNRAEEAKKLLKKAIKLDKEYSEAHFNLALAHEILEENELAFKVYTKLIEIRPSYIPAYNNLGSLHLREGDPKEALKVFKKILKINPEFLKAILGAALSYDKLGEFSLASRYYKKYLEKKPSSDNAVYINERLEDITNKKSYRQHAHLTLVK